MVRWAVEHHPVQSVVDLGCGDGGLLWSLRDLAERWQLRMWGYDLQPSNIGPAVSERGVDVRYGDVVTGDVEWADLAVCTEMIEHLVDPAAFVRRVAEQSRVVVASSPFTERPGSAYKFHTWAFDIQGYKDLLEQAGYEVVRHETTSMFQIALGVKP
ncbi:methyltransferase domain-containing protein [Kutzneria albida]|nr:methyltransferase domain-containing protein [Kutzneria albida]